MTASLTIDQQSIIRTLHTLGAFPRAVRVKVVRVAVNAGGGVIKKAEESRALRDTNTLAKSIRVKVKVPDASYNSAHHGRPAYAIVGPGRGIAKPVIRKGGENKAIGFKRAGKLIRAGSQKVVVRKPSRYAHHVEKKQSFVGASIQQSGQQALDKMNSKLAEGINQQAALFAVK